MSTSIGALLSADGTLGALAFHPLGPVGIAIDTAGDGNAAPGAGEFTPNGVGGGPGVSSAEDGIGRAGVEGCGGRAGKRLRGPVGMPELGPMGGSVVAGVAGVRASTAGAGTAMALTGVGAGATAVSAGAGATCA